MAIDLGTVNTIVYLRGRGIVLNEPSVVAIEMINGIPKLRAVGIEAKLMIGRTPQGMTTVRQMRDGVIADVDIAEQMIKAFIDKAHGGLVHRASARVGGDKMDDAIASSIRRNHNLVIGETTAERIKLQIGIARMPENGQGLTLAVRGRDLLHGVPRKIEITQADIAGPLSDLVNQIVETAVRPLGATERELAADIHEKGIVMTGGGSLLTGICEALAQATGVPVIVADDALTSVAMGAGQALEDPVYAGTMIND